VRSLNIEGNRDYCLDLVYYFVILTGLMGLVFGTGYRYPRDEGEGRDNPLSMVQTEFHVLVLFPDRSVYASRQNGKAAD